jgi:spore maturation protein CgeB
VDNEETAHQYRIAKVGINLYRREGEDGTDYSGWAMGPREVEMAACGLFFIRDPRPEGDELFDGILPTFHTPGEASELIRYWSHPKQDAERERLARYALQAIEDRTFENNARKFMQHMDDAGLLL